MLRIAVIGAGVVGVACATKIIEHYTSKGVTLQVSIISEDFTPNTTGDGAAGLWGPFSLRGPRAYKWSKKTHDFLEELWLSEDAGEAGVCLLPCIRLTTNEDEQAVNDDFWRDIAYGATKLSAKQLAEYNVMRKNKFTDGWSFVSYTAEPAKLLPYLMKRFIKAGGKISKGTITNLDEFLSNNNYNVVINCTGLASRNLAKDEQTYAIRGQISRVKANWLYQLIMDANVDGNYIIPNTESVVLGGTYQKNNYDRNVSATDRKFILEGCRTIVPGLVHAQHLFDWVGLRPGRSEPRVEIIKCGNKLLVHNYGHTGWGVTLSWGCACEVVDLLDNELASQNLSKL